MLKLIKSILRLISTWYAKRTVEKYGSHLKVNFFSKFNSKTIIGNHCNFNGMQVQGYGRVIIGDYFHSGKDISIINTNHKFEGANAIPYDSTAYVHKDVIIEDFVWVGNKAIILGGVTLGEGCIVQSGAVVVKDVPKYAIVGGNPATVFKTRNIAEFEKLKSERKFW